MAASISVAEAVWSEIRLSQSAVTDDQLSILHFLFGKNLERATRIVDQRGVKRVIGEPSGRSLFQVVGESRRREEYICFPFHYCSCYSFFYETINRGEQLTCKHQLAARLASSVGACVEVKMKLMRPIDLFQQALKNNKPVQGRFLGLDVGVKYVGLAISDPHNKIASPLSVLVRKKSKIDLMAKDFSLLISEFSLAGFIVGYPFDSQGAGSVEAVPVKLFMEELRNTGKFEGLPYTYWDERFTSKCVEVFLRPLNLQHALSKSFVDKFAAVGILQGYLDFVNRNLKETDSVLSR
ncbi:hypothetical protein H6P81_000261 [Aristolochia fimbriata]|uniref:SWIM-type domain-containing protein n=1 Tax=Aristolochia fimbriata TaxID=158543 RepID=A0AAV7F3V3_ARIFI|nr:hypothetical protein H6P81_000261 [Aristolochia fimbriata]